MAPSSSSSGSAYVQVRDGNARAPQWLHVHDPLQVIRADHPDQIMPALREAAAVTDRGQTVVGYVAYEAAPAFDSACAVYDNCPLPLAWFGVYPAAETSAPPASMHCGSIDWRPQIDPATYTRTIDRIREYIAAGDTYQVNFTTRLSAGFAGDPLALFVNLLPHQPHGYAAYLDIGDHAICSLSPELFFAVDGDRITCRPMKGTATRGASDREDDRHAEDLFNCPKNRAENVMIVDMIRNDLGRIAIPGSVEVLSLYDIERYQTVLQMTSTVTARSNAPVPDIFKALFPCASITGAPKIRSMQIIRELEDGPRGIYTGSIGILRPGRRAQWSVAIRTVFVDRRAGLATYGIGGGIVWDSTASEEYRECLTKALVLRYLGSE